MALEEEGAAGVLLSLARSQRVASAECSRTPCAQKGALLLTFLQAREPLNCTQGSAPCASEAMPTFLNC